MKLSPVSPPLTASGINPDSGFDKIIRYYKESLNDRYLRSYLAKGKMILKYRTKGGFFTRASFDMNGICILKEYFRDYDTRSGRVLNYLFTRKLPSLFG